MIMKQPPFRYNSKSTLIISVLQTLQPSLTPVYRRRENCHRLVDIFIHSVVHSFPYLSGQGSQQIHIVLADSPFGLS
jgi:hypothetical protein